MIKIEDNNLFSVKAYNYCADVYEKDHMDISPFQDEVDRFCHYLPSSRAKILDLGCGPGNYSKYLEENGFKNITGIDLSEEMIKRASKNVPNAMFRIGDIRKLQFPAASIHGIIASFCIPYLSYHETDAFILSVSKILKPSGLLYLSCIEGTHYGFEQLSISTEMVVFMCHYTEEFLTASLEERGLHVLSVNRYRYFEPDGRLGNHLVVIAQKP